MLASLRQGKFCQTEDTILFGSIERVLWFVSISELNELNVLRQPAKQKTNKEQKIEESERENQVKFNAE